MYQEKQNSLWLVVQRTSQKEKMEKGTGHKSALTFSVQE